MQEKMGSLTLAQKENLFREIYVSVFHGRLLSALPMEIFTSDAGLNYFATYPDLYFTGDGAFRDAEGNYRITGRVDDVLNVSGHRIGTAEVENAINMYPDVVESAVVGYPHDIKGQGIYAYVILQSGHAKQGGEKEGVSKMVNQVIGAIAKPDKIQFVSGLPKTRSGKIMRRILRKIAEGEMDNLGDISTLTDPGVVEEIKAGRV